MQIYTPLHRRDKYRNFVGTDPGKPLANRSKTPGFDEKTPFRWISAVRQWLRQVEGAAGDGAGGGVPGDEAE